MTQNLPIEALGAVVEINLDGLSEADADAVRNAWRDALADRPEGGATPAHPVVMPLVAPDRTAMLADLSQRVTLAALEQRRGELWMLHASGVAADDGRVVVLVGPSGRGKTTAARTLATHFGYVSDESVAVDHDGRVWPYRKPLSVIEERGAHKVQRPPSELGLLPLPGAALRLAAIVLLDRVAAAGEHAEIEALDLGEALGDLVSQSSYLTSMASPLHTIAALAAATGGIRRVTYREAASLPEAIHALFAESATPSAVASSPGRVVGEAAVPTRSGSIDPMSPHYSRAPYVDALELDEPDRLAILRSAAGGTGDLHVLAGVAPAIWRAAEGASLVDLTAAAIATYGQPVGEAAPIIEAAAEDLVAAGILRIDDASTAVPSG